RIAQRKLLLGAAVSHVTDDHKAGIDTHAHCQVLAQALHRCNGLYDTKASPDGPLGIVFMGGWKSKIHEQAITEILGNIAVVARYDLRAGRLVTPHKVPKYLGFQPVG